LDRPCRLDYIPRVSQRTRLVFRCRFASNRTLVRRTAVPPRHGESRPQTCWRLIWTWRRWGTACLVRRGCRGGSIDEPKDLGGEKMKIRDLPHSEVGRPGLYLSRLPECFKVGTTTYPAVFGAYRYVSGERVRVPQ